MNLKLHTTRNIELVTVERATAWIVVAFLVETSGNERRIVSGPKIVKVILKKTIALLEAQKQGSQAVLALPAPISQAFSVQPAIPSPFVSTIFGFSNSDVIIGLAARPPTL